MVARRGKLTACLSSGSKAVDENPLLVDAELAKGRFSFIYRGSFQKEIKIKHCVPLFKSRALCQSAIRSLQKALDIDEDGVIGYSCAGALKIVVKIPRSELHLVKSYLMDIRKTESEAFAGSHTEGIEWYGVVDDRHIHGSLLRLDHVRVDPFQDFKWTVTVINWQPVDVLKAFSRERNLLQSTNVVEMTIYDTLQGLREIAQEKAKLSGESLHTFVKQRGVPTQIAEEFCGGSRYSKHTTRTLAGAAVRLKPEAMRVLGDIMTEENTSIAKRILEQSTTEEVREEDIFDARAFKNLISTNTIRGAASFLNADSEDQVNSLLRLKFSYEENSFKCFQASRLNKVVERGGRARHQIQLMKVLMYRDNWPDELADIERKLLTSSHFDGELDKLDKKNDKIMKVLIDEYLERMPLEAGLRWRLYCSELVKKRKNVTQENTGECEAGRAPNGTHGGTGNERSSHSLEGDLGSMDVCPLERLNVSCLNVTLEKYSINRATDDVKFHLVTGDPSQLQLNGTCKVCIDDREEDKYIGILKPLVRDWGWVFFYTSALDYKMWYKAFRGNNFDPLEYPMLMVRDTDTIQMSTSPIPQNCAELLIGARKKGNAKPDFQADISSPYERPVSSRKRKFAILDSCVEPRLKLKKPNTREPLRTNERSAEAMAEFIKTFCPSNGNVLDAFSRTLETPKACYMTGRKCVALEPDTLCFDIAIARLKENAAGYLKENTPSLRDPLMARTGTPAGEEASITGKERDIGTEGKLSNREAESYKTTKVESQTVDDVYPLEIYDKESTSSDYHEGTEFINDV